MAQRDAVVFSEILLTLGSIILNKNTSFHYLNYLVELPNSRRSGMTSKTRDQFVKRAKVIKALAHPTRLFLVSQLAKKQQCVWDLTDQVGHDISTISKHLAILKSAGIVEDEKRGLQVCYKIRMACAGDFLECIDRLIQKAKKKLRKR